jgi:hypothetical protein
MAKDKEKSAEELAAEAEAAREKALEEYDPEYDYSFISDSPIAVAEYFKSKRDGEKQRAANEGGPKFDAGGDAAADRLAEKLGILSDEEADHRVFPGTGGHDAQG